MPDTAATATLTPPAPAASLTKSLDDWLTPETVEADFPAFTVNRLTKLRMGPDGPAFTKIGRAVMYRRGDLLDWLKANSRTTTNERRPGAGRRKVA
jgi:hypothetical protein